MFTMETHFCVTNREVQINKVVPKGYDKEVQTKDAKPEFYKINLTVSDVVSLETWSEKNER